MFGTFLLLHLLFHHTVVIVTQSTVTHKRCEDKPSRKKRLREKLCNVEKRGRRWVFKICIIQCYFFLSFGVISFFHHFSSSSCLFWLCIIYYQFINHVWIWGLCGRRRELHSVAWCITTENYLRSHRCALHPFQSVIIVQVEPPRTRVRSIRIEITRMSTTLSRRRRVIVTQTEYISPWDNFNLFSFSSKHLTCSRLYNKKKWVEKISESRNWDLCLWWPLLFCHTRSHSTSFHTEPPVRREEKSQRAMLDICICRSFQGTRLES